MRKRLLLAGLATLACAPLWGADALPERFDAARDATADVQQAVRLAQLQGKKVLVDVGGEWCTWCHVLDRFIASHPQVRRELDEDFVRLKVNYSPQNRNERLLARWPKAAGYPHFYVLDASGQLLASQATGEFENGRDYDEAKLLAFLRRYGATAR